MILQEDYVTSYIPEPDILLEAAKGTSAIKTKLYPVIEKLMDKNKNAYRKAVSKAIEKRQKDLFDIAPMNNIFWTEYDNQEFYKAIQIDTTVIRAAIDQTYYASISAFNPRSAKDEFTVMQMCIIRYWIMKNQPRDLELAIGILIISGKFYPSAFHMSYPTVAPAEYREIMVYAVNNELSNKFDLKQTGSLFTSLRNLGNTCFNSYTDMMKKFTDEDVVYVIQQVQTRLRSFMKNIAEVYYDCYENKNYITFDSDNFNEDEYRLADNDALKVERYVEITMRVINTTKVDYALCKAASSDLVSTEETKAIIEYILNDRENLKEVRELVRLMVNSYISQSKDKDIHNINFITYTISPKPNSKDPNYIRQKQIITGFLERSPSSFNRRRTRIATENAYYRAVYMYFARLIYDSNK